MVEAGTLPRPAAYAAVTDPAALRGPYLDCTRRAVALFRDRRCRPPRLFASAIAIRRVAARALCVGRRKGRPGKGPLPMWNDLIFPAMRGPVAS